MQVNERGHCVGAAVCLPLGHIALGVSLEESHAGKKKVRLDGALYIELTVVADKDEIGVFKLADRLKSLAEVADGAVNDVERGLEPVAEHAVGMATAVDIAVVDEGHLGLELADDVAAALYKEVVHLRVDAEVLAPGLYV